MWPLVRIGFIGAAVPVTVTIVALLTADRVQVGKRVHGALVIISAVALWAPLFTNGLSRLEADQFAQAFAQFLLAVQSLEMIRPRADADTNYLPGLGAITLLCWCCHPRSSLAIGRSCR